jgi:AhpD family alkylhydroperoxidase
LYHPEIVGIIANLSGTGRNTIGLTPDKIACKEKIMYEMAKLKNLKTLGAGAPKAMDAFWAFDKAAMADGVVPKKYKELIALGVALTTQCPYCLEVHRSAAEAAGATQEELAETALVAAALRAGAAVTHATHLFSAAPAAQATT